MSHGPYVSVIGLGFGDCGKGRFVDDLCPLLGARTVVRYNGGAQAGHNVVLPDGRHHVFSSFGAGSFHPGVATLLASPVVVEPLGLLREAAALEAKGVADPLGRLTIDERCRVTTPYLRAAGRLRELVRDQAHGSCGIGFGETVKLSLEAPELSLAYGQLADAKVARAKLQAQRVRLTAELGSLQPTARTQGELDLLADEPLGERWLEAIAELAQRVPGARREQVARQLASGSAIFEGAQGMLLDEDHGFHPHTTWSRIDPEAAEAVLRDAGIQVEMRHLGALRTYPTRHGEGPFPTEDPALDHLAEPHNTSAGWQGKFRRGHPDLVLLRYALAAASKITGLLASHLDAFDRGVKLRWCETYETPHGMVESLPRAAEPDLNHQQMLTDLLRDARPKGDGRPIADSRQWLDEMEALFPRQAVLLGSHGPERGRFQLSRRLTL